VSGDDPYGGQTAANTSPGWLNTTKDEVIDLDLDGMAEFAKDMVKVQDYLNARTGQLQLLAEMPTDAWEGNVLGEAGYIRSMMMNNYKGFTQYFSYLSIALSNVGMAAQTISDIYGSSDGWSAASLDAVSWAFGDKSAPRPGNLPSFVGETFWEKYNKALAAGAPPENAPDWVNQPPRTNADGSVTAIALGPDGQRKEITTFSVPGGGPTIVTTTLYDAKGKVVTQHSERTVTVQRGNSVVTRTEYTGPDGKPAGAQEKFTTYGAAGQETAHGRVTYGADGKPTSTTTDTTGADGSHHITTTNHDGKVVQDLHVGATTEGAEAVPDSPLQDTLDDIQQQDYGI